MFEGFCTQILSGHASEMIATPNKIRVSLMVYVTMDISPIQWGEMSSFQKRATGRWLHFTRQGRKVAEHQVAVASLWESLGIGVIQKWVTRQVLAASGRSLWASSDGAMHEVDLNLGELYNKSLQRFLIIDCW